MYSSGYGPAVAVNAIAKLKNLKAIHNCETFPDILATAVNAIAKLKNLKAIHNACS